MMLPSGNPRGLRSSVAESSSLLGLWYRLSAPRPVPANAKLEEREHVRRGRITSLILVGMLVAVGLVAIDVPLLRATLPSVALVVLGCLAVIALNRTGHVRWAGLLLVLVVDGALIWALLDAQGGLDPLFIPVFYLLVTSELIAVTLLRPESVFLVAAVQCAFIVMDVRLQPHTMMWDQMITSTGILYSLVVGPVALHVIVALVSYLWVKSAASALRRADRAEEIAKLEHRELQQRRELAEGIQQILATHLRVANGDLAARAPAHQDNVLWQVSVALNNLLARFQRLAQEDGFAQVMAQEVTQLRLALRAWQARQEPEWPRAAGTPLDPLVADLRQLFVYRPQSPRSGPPTPTALPNRRMTLPATPEYGRTAQSEMRSETWPDLWRGQE